MSKSCPLPTTTTTIQTRRSRNIMPTFLANDRVSLSYETHGSASNKPLILVN
jgi:hypothetical protein